MPKNSAYPWISFSFGTYSSPSSLSLIPALSNAYVLLKFIALLNPAPIPAPMPDPMPDPIPYPIPARCYCKPIYPDRPTLL
jgi:hypothetical protein